MKIQEQTINKQNGTSFWTIYFENITNNRISENDWHIINEFIESCLNKIEKSEKPINLTSSQTEISEHRFTEKDIRFAYMQGYNRGVDGNPNHMESYIEHLKSTKTSQTEISDEEIREQGIKYDNQALSETPIAHFMEGAFWYREQLKKKQ